MAKHQERKYKIGDKFCTYSDNITTPYELYTILSWDRTGKNRYKIIYEVDIKFLRERKRWHRDFNRKGAHWIRQTKISDYMSTGEMKRANEMEIVLYG